MEEFRLIDLFRDPILFVVSLVVLFIASLLFFKATARKPKFPYFSRSFLSKDEQKFYQALESAVNKNMRISVRPRLGDFVDIEDLAKMKEKKWEDTYGGPIWGNQVDFAIFWADNSSIALCVELNDNDNTKEMKFKKNILKAANIPLLCSPVKYGYNVKELKKQIHAMTKKRKAAA